MDTEYHIQDHNRINLLTKQVREITEKNQDGNTYYGYAVYGAKKSDSVWVIRKENSDGTEWVSSAMNVKWDDRLTTTYNLGND